MTTINKRDRREEGIKYRAKYPEQIRKRQKSYQDKNMKRIRANAKIYYEKNKEWINARNREYWEKNSEKLKQDRLNNISRIKLRDKSYRIKNRDKLSKNQNIYFKNRIRSDEKFRIKMLLRARVRNAFKAYSDYGKQKPADEYGIDYSEIVKHLMKTLPEDILDYQIHHITPLYTFDFNNPEEIKKAFTPENHQWVTIEEHKHIHAQFEIPYLKGGFA